MTSLPSPLKIRASDSCPTSAWPGSSTPGSAQQIPVDARLTVETDTVRIGDPFRVFVSVRVPKGATIDFPVAFDSSGTVQSIDPRAVFAQPDSFGFRQNAVYRVAAWDIG